jgi:transposase-like protein
MTKAVEVITSVQRRRRWSRAEKEQIVAAALEPGASASEVARAAGIHVSQLFRWRQQLCERTQVPAGFNPVDLARLDKAPIAIEAVERIDTLLAIERDINGLPPQQLLRVRNERSRPHMAALEAGCASSAPAPGPMGCKNWTSPALTRAAIAPLRSTR